MVKSLLCPCNLRFPYPALGYFEKLSKKTISSLDLPILRHSYNKSVVSDTVTFFSLLENCQKHGKFPKTENLIRQFHCVTCFTAFKFCDAKPCWDKDKRSFVSFFTFYKNKLSLLIDEIFNVFLLSRLVCIIRTPKCFSMNSVL